MRAQTETFGTNSSTISTRQTFEQNLINTLQTGASNLVLADQNQESANLLTVQTQQQLEISALSIANQANQSVLKLFPLIPSGTGLRQGGGAKAPPFSFGERSIRDSRNRRLSPALTGIRNNGSALEDSNVALKIELKPDERVILGDCVITNDDQRTRLVIEGRSPILREKDIMTAEPRRHARPSASISRSS